MNKKIIWNIGCALFLTVPMAHSSIDTDSPLNDSNIPQENQQENQQVIPPNEEDILNEEDNNSSCSCDSHYCTDLGCQFAKLELRQESLKKAIQTLKRELQAVKSSAISSVDIQSDIEAHANTLNELSAKINRNATFARNLAAKHDQNVADLQVTIEELENKTAANIDQLQYQLRQEVDKQLKQAAVQQVAKTEEILNNTTTELIAIKRVLGLPNDQEIDLSKNNIAKLMEDRKADHYWLSRLQERIGAPEDLDHHQIFVDLTPDLPTSALTLTQMITTVADQLVDYRDHLTKNIQAETAEKFENLQKMIEDYDARVAALEENDVKVNDFLTQISSDDLNNIKNLNELIRTEANNQMMSPEFQSQITIRCGAVLDMTVAKLQKDSHDTIEALQEKDKNLQKSVEDCDRKLSEITQELEKHLSDQESSSPAYACQEDIEALNTKYDTLKTTVDGHTTYLDSFQTTANTIQTALSGYNSSIEALRTTDTTLTADLKTVQTDLESIQDALSELQKKDEAFSNLENQQNDAIKQLQALIGQGHEEEEAGPETSLISQIAALRTQLDAVVDQLKESTLPPSQEGESVEKSEWIALTKQIEAIRTQLGLTEDNVSSSPISTSILEQINALTSNITQLQTTLNENISEVSNRIQNLEEADFATEIEQLKTDLQTTTNAVTTGDDALSARLQTLENANLDTRLTNLEALDLAQLKTDVAALQPLSAAVEALQQSKADATDVQQLQQDIENLQQIKADKTEVQTLQEDVKNLEQLKEEVEALQQNKADATVLEQLQQDVENLQQIKTDVDTLKQLKTDVENLTQLETDVENLKQNKADAADVQALQTKLAEVEQFKTTVEEMNQSKANVEEIEQIKTSIEQLQSLKTQVETLEQNYESIPEDLKEIEATIDQLTNRTLPSLSDLVSAQQATLTDYGNRIVQLETTVENLLALTTQLTQTLTDPNVTTRGLLDFGETSTRH